MNFLGSDESNQNMAITKQGGGSSSKSSVIENAFDCKDHSKSKLFEGYQFDKEGFEKLFHELDVDKDGRIGVDELSNGLKRLGIDHLPDQAQVGFRSMLNLISYQNFYLLKIKIQVFLYS